VNNAFAFRAQVAGLKARTDTLQATLARTELDANIARREILRSAKATIKSALKKTLGGVSAETSIRALLDVSDDVVRPLSRQLLYRPGTFAGVQPAPVRTTLQFWEIINLGSSTRPFRPEATVIVGGMLSLGSAVTSAPYGLGVVAMVALLVIPFTLLWLANRFLTEPIRRLGAVARFFAVGGVFTVVCGIDSLAVGIRNGLTWPLILVFMTYATLLGSLVMWYIATVTGVRRGHAEVIEKFREVNRELEWAVARVNARLWTDQKELSRILHNEVQGVLVATAFKLQRDMDSGQDVDVDVDAIRATVLEALESPTAPSATPSLERMLTDECERWQGVLNISWDIDEPSLKTLNEDRDSRRVIGDLVGEFLTNAVKHGKAHQISIWMRPTSRGTMDVSLYNDGAPLPKDRVPGLGTELAYSVSTSVRLPPRKTGVEVRLEIPCEGFGAHAQSASRRATAVE
jgi:signal transduction histidine kinase